MAFQLVAQLPNGQQKSVLNRTEDQVVAHVVEFLREQTLTTRWGNKTQTRQAYELRVYDTDPYDKKRSGPLADFLKRKRNVFARFEKEAQKQLTPVVRPRVFVVMPIQGDRYGTQSSQSIYREFNERFDVIEQTVQQFDCVAIRIDREAPLGGLVDRIKQEIRRAQFVIADLTDERPSCYFEVGFAEALGKPVVFVASRESVMDPGVDTTIHFDIHQNVQFFSNHEELAERLATTVDRNRPTLLPPPSDPAPTLTNIIDLTHNYLSANPVVTVDEKYGPFGRSAP